MPNTDQQTFQMSVPIKLRSQYDRVIAPINNPQVKKQHEHLNDLSLKG